MQLYNANLAKLYEEVSVCTPNAVDINFFERKKNENYKNVSNFGFKPDFLSS